jgi:hypothetical protein
VSAFERFGIKHLSPSSLNKWRSEPALWVVQYLHGFREDAGPAAWRGAAVEAGLEHWLRKRNSEAAFLHAAASFEANAQGVCDEETSAERENVPAMLKVAIESFGEPPELMAAQLRIECFLDGVSIPVCGYIDFCFEEFDVDLKTTKQCPSSPRPDHARQAALYRYARGKEGGLHYVTGKKWARYMLSDEEANDHIIAMRRDALALQRFLEAAESPSEAIKRLPCNTDSFFWSDGAVRRLSEILEAA